MGAKEKEGGRERRGGEVIHAHVHATGEGAGRRGGKRVVVGVVEVVGEGGGDGTEEGGGRSGAEGGAGQGGWERGAEDADGKAATCPFSWAMGMLPLTKPTRIIRVSLKRRMRARSGEADSHLRRGKGGGGGVWEGKEGGGRAKSSAPTRTRIIRVPGIRDARTSPTARLRRVCVCGGGRDGKDVMCRGGGKQCRRDSGGLLMRRVGGWARDARGGRARPPLGFRV